jgi:periplasmic copper chaperone A
MDRRITTWLLAAAFLLIVGGCSAASPGSSTGPSPLASGAVTVADAWVRPAPTTAANTAGYVTITNGGSGDDALLSATSPDASDVEVHETSMDSGMAAMKPVDRVPVPAGGTVRLEPGGYHLMIMGLSRTLAPGDTIELHLTFEHAGTIMVKAEVRQG